ncbi:glycogen debranching protein GlgX [Allorhizobium sp. BGMRC 0089]|uniref:glycogen debranching protein GlgX n=1 Tax=Allorhizobium sonneratiae TaxID=2934936 RepID=UPI0020341E81|nr:glycogen debranching protein GlgX [Allorhizobium sonneratiae]MCM2290830.1 glycogen debranching protein GlgX [Allorhizobium sonneratiae]
MAEAGGHLTEKGAEFSVYSRHATQISLCLFDSFGETELCRLPMQRQEDGWHHVAVEGIREGALYGYRAEGDFNPDNGLWFDPAKLLVDPYALEIDRPFRHDPALQAFGTETAHLMPKARLIAPQTVKIVPPLLPQGGFIYEISVRGFTMLHPDIAEEQRGTVAALAHPAILRHLKHLGVDAVELMPITAWIDERHLSPLGLTNSWGYNPVAFAALDPRLCPGGWRELSETVATLHDNGIGVILDLVFNHTGESDRHGTTLSLRGLDNLSYYRHLPNQPGELVNDTGCGNTLACDAAPVRDLIVSSLRRFVRHAGVDGFRFDLAPVLGRTAQGFEPQGETLTAMLNDELLKDRVMIAEPWDIGPGGYQLGRFPAPFLEWNDRARDTIRRFWRGDTSLTGEIATILAGSSDIFGHDGAAKTRSVNFIAAHDGFTLCDLVSYARKHNEDNGEDNRDGHNENYSWNHGVEGKSEDPAILAARRRDLKALIATLFVSKGWVMMTAGDEGGRSQNGNNNAYAQDNAITWLDWQGLDRELIDHAACLSRWRKRFNTLADPAFFTGTGDIAWLSLSGQPMTVEDWQAEYGPGLAMLLTTNDGETGKSLRLAIAINRHRATDMPLPQREGWAWQDLLDGDDVTRLALPERSLAFAIESPRPD